MKKNYRGRMPTIFKRLLQSGKTLLQRMVITFKFFGENGLANHAAACSYGFLLSVAPLLMLLSFFLLAAFRSIASGGNGTTGALNALNPEFLAALVSNIPFIKGVLDETWLVTELPSIAESVTQLSGIAGIVSVVGIFWAGRVFALSLQRGLKVIFTGTKKRNPVTETITVLFAELAVLIGALMMILLSRAVRSISEMLAHFPIVAVFLDLLSRINFVVVSAALLVIVFYCVCRFLTANGPRHLPALWGSLCFAFSHTVFSRIFTLLLSQTRYNFLYGALGSLILLLVNVYFFFMFFFFSAQFSRVLDSGISNFS